jgi:prephenate dehydrogenase
MTKPPSQRITIVGAGCIGASMGLAIRQSPDADRLEVVGHDRSPGRARRAKALGAFDKVTLNLDVALRGAALVIIAVPLASLREVLQDVGRLLTPDAAPRETGTGESGAPVSGTVITSVVPLIVPSIAWADAALPAGVHYVAGDPFLAPGVEGWEPLEGLSSASPALFSEAIYAIAPGEGAHPSAVRTVRNLALVLGATPRYMDPIEHDGVRSMAATVPALLATALFQATSQVPGWMEVRRAAGREFATATASASGDTPSRRMATLLDRTTVLLGLDEVIAALGELRAAIADGDAEALDAALSAAARGREEWMLRSQARTWDAGPEAPMSGGLFARTLQMLVGGGFVKGPDQDLDH